MYVNCCLSFTFFVGKKTNVFDCKRRAKRQHRHSIGKLASSHIMIQNVFNTKRNKYTKYGLF